MSDTGRGDPGVAGRDDPRVAERDDPEVARAQLEELRDRVMNVVGHALATPVATLRGLTRSLLSDLDEGARVEVVAALDRTAARIEHLVDDLLVANGIETRLPVQEPRPVVLADVVTSVWGDVGQDGAIEITGSATAHAPPSVVTWMLRQLLDNAARYGDGRTSVRLSQNGERARIEIENGGAALPDDEVANAFELFYRGHDAVMRVAARLGLGLAVVRRLEERAAASVTLEARDGGGALVTVVLPTPAGAA